MRLKEFIIFIIFFTIIYVLGFVIHDYFQRKRDLKKLNENKQTLIDITKYQKFANFYNLSPTATIEVLRNIYTVLQNNFYINISTSSKDFNIPTEELVIIILYLEYIGLIKKRGISFDSNSTFPLNNSDESLIMKYSLYFSNKMTLDEITKSAGLNSSKEIEYLYSKLLLPGVIIDNNCTYYVGDLDE